MRQSLRINQYIFQSTLSVRRATFLVHRLNAEKLISIHALRKESDADGYAHVVYPAISIHALRKESDMHRPEAAVWFYISIHALRKESDRQRARMDAQRYISIHALRKESDAFGACHC